MREALESGDWLFIFKTAKEPHLYERHEQEKEYLTKMKYVSGDLNIWITRFDHEETCLTVGVDIGRGEDSHFMSNPSDIIFGEVMSSFMNRSATPYGNLKQRIIDM